MVEYSRITISEHTEYGNQFGPDQSFGQKERFSFAFGVGDWFETYEETLASEDYGSINAYYEYWD